MNQWNQEGKRRLGVRLKVVVEKRVKVIEVIVGNKIEYIFIVNDTIKITAKHNLII